MLQRWVSKLRPFTLSSSSSSSSSSYSLSHRALLHSSPHIQNPVSHSVNNSIFHPIFHTHRTTTLKPQTPLGFQPFTLLPLNQRRFISSKERRLKRLTPITSKVKKIKIKSYSSFKLRFRTMNDGQIRRWRAGKRHNAHLKVVGRTTGATDTREILVRFPTTLSKISKRRLRQPALVHPAYAKVMKKLNFCG